MSKKKEIHSGDLVKIEPITDNQKLLFEGYKQGKNGFYFGCATGKTFVSLYLALQDVLKHGTPYERVVIVRSLIPTREIGFLQFLMRKIKFALYQVPYANMVQFMFKQPNEDAFRGLYDALKDRVVYILYLLRF